jgi:high affinity Mn2+ porin
MEYSTSLAADAPTSRRLLRAMLLAAILGAIVDPASAAGEAPADDGFPVYGQATNVTQTYPSFRAPYSAQNSLKGRHDTQETTDLTLYLGHRLWHGSELWVNGEVDQGFGLSNTVGVAGFPSGEAYKIGASAPYLRLPRAFLRQAIPLGGVTQRVGAAANQLAGETTSDNLVLTVGKFSVVDIFDTNAYAHDPRGDFLNWSVIDAGAFDYAADAWGYTYGAAAEWNRSWWTLRAGLFEMSPVPNGKVVKVDFNARMAVLEWEIRHDWAGQPGKLKLLAFSNRAAMGSYRDAVRLGQQLGMAPDVARVRRRASRAGVAVNVEQALSPDLGLFARASANDGGKEAYEFTEINRSLSAGLQLKGRAWGRADDKAGVAVVVNGLSHRAREYFAAGGLGILIGDGRLRYGSENILEMVYAMRLLPAVALSMDYQHIGNPAYNRDRGPVSVWGLRLHGEF